MDLPAVDLVVAQQRADAMLERTGSGGSDGVRLPPVKPPASPLLRLRIEGANADATPGPRRCAKHVVAHVAKPAHDPPVVERALELFPTAVRLASTIVYAPFAGQKIPIAGFGRQRRFITARNRRSRGAGAREVVAPVGFPVLAPVRREGLVPVRTLAVDFVPPEADFDGLSVEDVLAD